MEQFLRVKDNDNLVRDANTGAILNLNNSERASIMRKRSASLNAKQEIEKQNAEINNIKTELSEIKDLLLSLIQSKT